MTSRVLLAAILVFSLIACGGKQNIKTNVKNDTTGVKTDVQDTSKPSINNSNTKTVITDSNQVYTDTEILNDQGQLDPNSSPQALVQTIIKAAKTGNYGPLAKISSQAVEMDGDAKDIVNIANSSKEHQKEFKDYFGNAKIVGKPRIKKNIAEVDIETTAEGGEKETIICENKYDKWYLKGM